jgi:hypothetical protein
VPARAVSRVLARNGVARLASVNAWRAGAHGCQEARPHPRRWRLAHPWPRDRVNGPGTDYVHLLVDDYSRLAYSEILANEQGPTCAGFLSRTDDYFAAHGITNIEPSRCTEPSGW